MPEDTIQTVAPRWVPGDLRDLDLVQRATIAGSLSRPLYTFFKRLVDVVASLCGILLCLPLWAMIAVLIKLDSSGPVFFRQKRPGLRGVPFTLYKFRTMASDAEDRLRDVMHLNREVSGSLIRIDDDPRVTRVGRFLRASSLDETPQLVNILLGHMSLVGPRPISRPITDTRNPVRLGVLPGLTGLWQISGRKNTGCAYMIERDLEYICNRSILYDLRIIIQTVLVVLRRTGAK